MKRTDALPRGDPELGGILRGWRESAGYTQEDMARLLGMARASYNATEQGHRAVTSNELRQLASVFEVSIAQLVQPNGHIPPPKQASFWEMLIEEARELSVRDRAMLLEFVRFLRSRKEG